MSQAEDDNAEVKQLLKEWDEAEKVWQEQKNAMLATKFDLEEVLADAMHWRQEFFEQRRAVPPTITEGVDSGDDGEPPLRWDDPYIDLSTAVHAIGASLLAPAYHYNQYIEAAVVDIGWDYEKYNLSPDDPHPSGMLRRLSTQVAVQSLLIAIKSALDRLVFIFRFFYPGMGDHTTFGRIKEDGSPRGFMQRVAKDHQSDPLLDFIYSEYNDWIKHAVAPRDAIIHYHDLVPLWTWDSKTGLLYPRYTADRTDIATEEPADGESASVNRLLEYTTRFYVLFQHVLAGLKDRPLVKRPPRL